MAAAAAEAAPGPDLKTAASYVPTRATKKKMARSFCPGKLPLKNDSDAAAAAAVGRSSSEATPCLAAADHDRSSHETAI